jgi:arylsulfatase A-like enzyme
MNSYGDDEMGEAGYNTAMYGKDTETHEVEHEMPEPSEEDEDEFGYDEEDDSAAYQEQPDGADDFFADDDL